ncbi:hypothetical protein ABZW11_41700 [Nonomuraea sp. NPDC004580]|uniref:hypothetical protein n=1 Tax=Nonomuraea sp. NPDC004580 TaxID=3154552 RepID=UPI0033BA45C3
MDLAVLTDEHLVGVVAAQFVHGADAPEVIEVWLRLESVIVGVRVAADWSFQIAPDEPGQGYVLEEWGDRVDVVSAPDSVPFVRHIGERLVRVVERFCDGANGPEVMGAEFVFESGSVVAESWGGDLRLTRG